MHLAMNGKVGVIHNPRGKRCFLVYRRSGSSRDRAEARRARSGERRQPVAADRGPLSGVVGVRDRVADSGSGASAAMTPLIAGPVRQGRLKIEFRPWTVISPESDSAARAAYAAGQQGRF